MQHFAIAGQYMSKHHPFSHVIMLHFYFGCFLSWFAVMLKIGMVQYACNIKGTYVQCNLLFTEFINLDKK